MIPNVTSIIRFIHCRFWTLHGISVFAIRLKRVFLFAAFRCHTRKSLKRWSFHPCSDGTQNSIRRSRSSPFYIRLSNTLPPKGKEGSDNERGRDGSPLHTEPSSLPRALLPFPKIPRWVAVPSPFASPRLVPDDGVRARGRVSNGEAGHHLLPRAAGQSELRVNRPLRRGFLESWMMWFSWWVLMRSGQEKGFVDQDRTRIRTQWTWNPCSLWCM